jgi:ABC-type oligopeptide transport system substrate-binding subunit
MFTRKSNRFLVFVSILLALSACSKVGDATDKSTTTLNRGLSAEPESLDPHRFASNGAAEILRDIGEGLLTYSADGSLIGGVASSWRVSGDGLVYTFELRKEAKWMNGDPVTSSDFVFALRRLVDPEIASPYALLLESIGNVSQIVKGELSPAKLAVVAIDDDTLQIELSVPTPYFVQLLTHPSAFPLHADSAIELGDEFSRPGNFVSNGAYTLVDWVVGSRISLKRNANYWRDAESGFDRVSYHVVQESAEVNRFRAGDLDITANIDSAMFDTMLEERPDEVRVSSYLGVFYYGFNLKSELFSNKPDLRRALSMAVDRDVLVEAITGRGELPAYGWVPPGINGYNSQSLDYSTISKSQRETEARRLYESAGYGSDNPLEFELRYNTSTVQTRIAVAIQSMWRKVLGAEVTLINEEFRVLLSNIQSMEVAEMFRLSWTGDYNDPLTFLQLFESGNPSNLTAYSNSRVDALLKDAAVQVDTIDRMALLEKVEATAISEHPVIPLYFYVSKHLVRNNILGWHDNVLDFHYTQHLRPK